MQTCVFRAFQNPLCTSFKNKVISLVEHTLLVSAIYVLNWFVHRSVYLILREHYHPTEKQDLYRLHILIFMYYDVTIRIKYVLHEKAGAPYLIRDLKPGSFCWSSPQRLCQIDSIGILIIFVKFVLWFYIFRAFIHHLNVKIVIVRVFVCATFGAFILATP